MSYLYVDKNNEDIKPGYMIKIGDDDPELVYTICNQFGEDLGINASNEAYLKIHPDAVREYYSLSNFDSKDIEIVKREGCNVIV